MSQPKKKARTRQVRASGKLTPAASYFPTRRRSIIGVAGLNYRVRDGIGCGPGAMATGNLVSVYCCYARA